MADALEGYRSIPEGNHAASVIRIKQKLRRQNQKKRFIALRIAASIAFLIISASIFWYLNSNSNQKLVEQISSQVEDSKKQIETPIVRDTIVFEQKELAQIAQPKKREPSIKNKITAPEKRQAITAEEASINPPTNTPKPVSIAVEKKIAKPSESDILAFDEKPVTEEEELSDEEIFAALEKEEIETIVIGEELKVAEDTVDYYSVERLKTVSGRITNRYGEPVIGAIVFSPSVDKQSITDNFGRFNLEYADNKRNLKVAAPGFQTAAISFNPVDTLDIIINADTEALAQTSKRQDKAKLFGYRKKDKQSLPVVQPQGGFEIFNSYISNNLNYPLEAKNQQIEGKVKLQFTIKKNGELTNFKILESLGYGCDEEAIRLMKQGPKWSIPAGRKKWVASYVVEFKGGE